MHQRKGKRDDISIQDNPSGILPLSPREHHVDCLKSAKPSTIPTLLMLHKNPKPWVADNVIVLDVAKLSLISRTTYGTQSPSRSDP